MIDYAIKFAEEGFHVFPLLGRCISDENKIGTPIGWNHNREDDSRSIPSTIDIDKISSWPTFYKDLIGYAVNPRDRRAIILDVDVKHGKVGADSLKSLQNRFKISLDTKIVRSKSGGLHLYYEYDGVPDDFYVKGTSIPGFPDIDLRTDNNFVVGPSDEGKYSLIRDVPMARLPQDLINLLPIAPINPLSSVIIDPQDASSLIYDDESLKGDIPEYIPLGSRDNTLIKLIGSWARRGLSKDVIISLTELAILRCEQKRGDELHISEYIPKIETTLAKTNFVPNISDKLQWLIDNLIYVEKQNVIYNINKRMIRLKAYAETFFANFIYYVETSSGAKRKVKAFSQWLESQNRQSVESYGYVPRDQVTLYDPVQMCDIVNTYRPPYDKDYKPKLKDPGVGELFQEFCEYLFEGDAEYMIQWAAHQIQRPYEKLSIAPIMVSQERGVGKNLFFDLVRASIGNDNATDADITEVIDKHCEFPLRHHLVLINETNVDARDKYTRNARNNIIERLKSKITENKQTVEPKYISRFNIQSFINYIIATNNIDAVPIEQNDRRFYVIDIRVKKRTWEYYAKLWAIVNSRDFAFYLREYLKTVDISLVKAGLVSDNITVAKQRMIDAHKSSEQLNVEDAIDDRYSIFKSNIITQELFIWFVRQKLEGGSRLSTGAIQSLFRKYFKAITGNNTHGRAVRLYVKCPQKFVNGDLVDGETKRCAIYSVRDHDKMEECSHDWLKKEYERAFEATHYDYMEPMKSDKQESKGAS